ncbi:MAG: Ig-like domain repeat protein [Thermoleophilaceae bacterium]|nr:Ig-like domain repeat protein [Thermoleophilaceae bacterium]
MNFVLGNRASGNRTILTLTKLVLAALLIAAAVLLQLAAFSAPAEAAKKKKPSATPAPQNCTQAVNAVNSALRARAVPRYRLKTAKTSRAKKRAKKSVKKADKRVNAARAALKVQCQGAGTTSALDAKCSITFTQLDKLIGLEYDRKMQLRKIKGNSKRAKQRKKVLRKRIKMLGYQIKVQNTTFSKACDKTGSGGGSGSGDIDLPAFTSAPGNVTITGPSTTDDSTPTFTITPPEGETSGHIECKIDAGGYVTVTSPWTTPTLADGTHTITCRYVDEVGNAGDPTTVTVTIDATPPSSGPTITVPGTGNGGATNAETPTVEVTPPAGESGGYTECKISGSGYNGEFADFTIVDAQWILPMLTEGTYTITCHYVDKAGNVGPNTTYTLTIDRTAPGAPTIAGPASPTMDDTPTFDITRAEPGGRLGCAVDGVQAWGVSSPLTTEPLTEGTHLFQCAQIDDAGNLSPIAELTIVIDTTPPGAVTISGPGGATSDSTPSFNLSGAGQGDTYECKTGDGPFATTTSVYTTTALAEGTHDVTCHLVDAAGNVGPDQTASVTVDTAAPGSVTITGPANTSDTTPTVTITTSATGGSVECKIDNGSFNTVTSPWTLPELAEGSHTVTCHYVSGTGVNGPDSSYTVVIDTTAPSALTITGPSGLINDNTPTYALTGGNGGTLQCKVDGADYANVASPYTTAPLSEGAHTISCRAVDAAGNSTAVVSRSVTVDTTVPTITIADGPLRWDGKHDFTISSSEAGTTYQCKVDSGAYAAVTSPYTTAALANGSHTFTCIGTDAAGNASSPVVKNFGVFQEVLASKTVGFQWGLVCTGSSSLNSLLGCPDNGLTINIPANPNGITGNYAVDLNGQIKGLASTVGVGSTYTMNIIVDGNAVASDSVTVWLDIFGVFRADLSAVKNNLTLSAASGHTIQLSLKSSSVLSVLPSVSSSTLSASIHH